MRGVVSFFPNPNVVTLSGYIFFKNGKSVMTDWVRFGSFAKLGSDVQRGRVSISAIMPVPEFGSSSLDEKSLVQY